MTLQGSCLCGKITIEMPEPEKKTVGMCHCTMCQRFFGGPMISLSEAPKDEVIIGGKAFLKFYDSSEWAERGFCSECGSSLCYRFKETGEISFSAGAFRDLDNFHVNMEICTDTRPNYLAPQPDAKQYTTEAFMELIGVSTGESAE